MLDATDDPDADLAAFRVGAFDYLRKDRITPEALLRSVRYAYERSSFQSAQRDSQDREKHIERLTILRQVDAELSHILNINNVLALALDATVRLSGANAGYIGLMNNGRVEMAQTLGYYSTLPDSYVLETPLIQSLIETPEARLIFGVDKDPDLRTIVPDTRAQMLLPLLSVRTSDWRAQSRNKQTGSVY